MAEMALHMGRACTQQKLCKRAAVLQQKQTQRALVRRMCRGTNVMTGA